MKHNLFNLPLNFHIVTIPLSYSVVLGTPDQRHYLGFQYIYACKMLEVQGERMLDIWCHSEVCGI